MQVRVRYFAALREQRGLDVETVDTRARTYGELYRELAQRHGLALGPELVRPAVNDRFREMSDSLAEGEEVLFLPPVAGG